MELLPLGLPSLWYFPVLRGSAFWSSGQKSGALLSLFFYELPITASASSEKWCEDRERKSFGSLPHTLETTAALIRRKILLSQF